MSQPPPQRLAQYRILKQIASHLGINVSEIPQFFSGILGVRPGTLPGWIGWNDKGSSGTYYSDLVKTLFKIHDNIQKRNELLAKYPIYSAQINELDLGSTGDRRWRQLEANLRDRSAVNRLLSPPDQAKLTNEQNIDRWNKIAQFKLTPREAKILLEQVTAKRLPISAEVELDVGDGNIVTVGIIVRNTSNVSAQRLIDLLTRGTMIDDEFFNDVQVPYGSDAVADLKFATLVSIKFKLFKPNPKKVTGNTTGGFFRYFHDTDLDLRPYQIYSERDYKIGVEDDQVNCLIYALRQAGIEQVVLDRVVRCYCSKQSAESVTGDIPMKDLKTISEIIGRPIILHKHRLYDGTDRCNIKKKTITSKHLKNKKPVEIALYADHYFLFEMTDISRYYVSHLKDLKTILKGDYDEERLMRDLKGLTRHGKPIWLSSNTTKGRISSLTLVFTLHRQGLFSKYNTKITKNPIAVGNKLIDVDLLENVEGDQREYKFQSKKKAEFSRICYADCETFVHDQCDFKKDSDPHSLYLLGVTTNEGLYSVYNTVDLGSEENVARQFLSDLTEGLKSGSVLVYFHNLKYDCSILQRWLKPDSKVKKDGQLYQLNLSYNGIRIVMRDSYKHLPMPLSKFCRSFDLPDRLNKKEGIGYAYYTKNNHRERCHIDDYGVFIDDQDQQKIFYEMVEKDPSYDPVDQTFDPFTYYTSYLELDCKVLQAGFEKYHDSMWEISHHLLNVHHFLTISSLANRLVEIHGGFNGIYELRGGLREYVKRCTYGGRVHVNEDYKCKVIEGKIADYDGVSLYPSAIVRMCKEGGGLPLGKAKRFNNAADSWEEKPYSCLTVKITKIGKRQQMPIIALRTETSLEYINELPDQENGLVVYIDNLTLKDYIDLHCIEYEVLDGVYWEKTGNVMMGEVTGDLFAERLKYKSSGNISMSNVLKLLLNSMYGKTIMKKSNKEVKMYKVKGATTWEDHFCKNFGIIESYIQIQKDKLYEVTTKCIDDSFNKGHIGSCILSWSKRIMNEVFSVANDNGFNIYYTDTDSMHCDYDDVERLKQQYQQKYGRELDGKQLGQFHVDFDLAGARGPIYATKSIFLGKKSYIDMLESVDAGGQRITGCHKRLKGITKAGLEYTAGKYKEGMWGLYKDLASGTTKRILLNPEGKVLFKYSAGKVFTRGEFRREVKF